MAYEPGLNGVLKINAGSGEVDITQYLDSVDPEFTRAIIELRHLGASWVAQLAGLRLFNLKAAGDWEPTLDATLWAFFNGDTASTFKWYPHGGDSGDIYYSGSCRCPNYVPGAASSDGAVKTSFGLVSDGTVSRSTV